jgi:tetratricopeptide (TPR) repeat protein
MQSIAEGYTPLDDASAAGHLLALRALLKIGKDPTSAYALSGAALKSSAPAAALHVLRAMVLASSGGVEDALLEGQRALGLRDDASRRAALGQLLLLAGRVEEAIGALERALQKEPAYWPAHRLMVALFLSGDREKGEKHLKAALEVAPEEPSLLELQAAVQLQSGQAREAAALLRGVARRRPSEHGLLLLYQALVLGEERSEAAAVRKQLLAMAKDPRELARALERIDAEAKGAKTQSKAPPRRP